MEIGGVVLKQEEEVRSVEIVENVFYPDYGDGLLDDVGVAEGFENGDLPQG